MDSDTRISVSIRLRPMLKEEVDSGYSCSRLLFEQDSSSIIVATGEKTHKTFAFDNVFSSETTQEDLFRRMRVSDLLKKVVQGFNATIFAYGQTGSGKTFTMEGYEYNSLKPNIKESARQGIVPRAVKALFDEINSAPQNLEYTVYCTYLQVYQEKIFDLLNPAQLKQNSQGLKMRWSKQEDFYVENLYVHPCSNANEVLTHFHAGLKNKIMAAHNLNSASSRSHCILSLTIEGVDSEGGGLISSKLQLVDLAGSERVSLTGNEGAALKESIEINKSLFTLRQVITTLSSNREGESHYIPYRDSKLTSLLKQSIGGNSFCLMIACLSPCDHFLEENLSTLAYATKASSISNDPIKNLDPKTKLVKDLRREIKSLKSELSEAHEQIEILTELAALDRSQQEARLKEMENTNFASAHIQRIQALRSNLETAPARIHSAMVVQRPPADDFGLSPELLSEKLHDSVKMIKDLMASNRKLKESINELTLAKKNQEAEISQLQTENQLLLEKMDCEPETSTVARLQRDKEELMRRIAAMEQESRSSVMFTVKEKKNEWAWKSKRTIVRAGIGYVESPGQFIDKDPYQRYQSVRPNTRVRVEKSVESARPPYESPETKIKDEALSTLSVLYNKAKVKKYGTFF